MVTPGRLRSGEMRLDVETARGAITAIGTELGLDVYQAAQGILDIVNENMAGALRLVSVQRGYDPRDFARRSDQEAMVSRRDLDPENGEVVQKRDDAWRASDRPDLATTRPRSSRRQLGSPRPRLRAPSPRASWHSLRSCSGSSNPQALAPARR